QITASSMSRRRLLKAAGAGAGLVVVFGVPVQARQATPEATPDIGVVNARGINYNGSIVAPPFSSEADAFIKINEDGTVTLATGKIEFGQGIRTGFMQLIAEELDVDFDQVEVSMAQTDVAAPEMGSFGSMSTRVSGPVFQKAAATMRAWLLELAAEALGDDVADLTVASGIVTGPSGTKTYAELAGGQQSMREISEDATPKNPSTYTIIGKSIPRVDMTAKSTGQQVYGIDIEVEGMVYGKVVRPPSLDATLDDVDFTEALAMPGIVGSIRDGNFAAIAGERKDQVEAAIKAVKASWTESGSAITSENIYDRIKETADAGKPLDQEDTAGDPDTVLAGIESAATYTYRVPFLSHSPIEPKSAVADVREDGVDIWVSTQDAFSSRAMVAKLLGRDENEVIVHGQHPGGAFGSKIVPQAELEAAMISQELGRPVKLIWDRIEEFQFGQFRPAMQVEITAGLDEEGAIAGWKYDAYAAAYYPEGSKVPTGSASDWSANIHEIYPDVAESKTILYQGVSPLPPYFWRVNGATTNTFARESTLDILAEQAGVDPVSFRDAMLANAPRLAATMHAAVDASGWKPGVGSTGEGYGIALGSDAGSFIAQVARVQVDPDSGELKILSVDAAIDPGLALNPEAITHQIEGAIVQSLSAAIREEITFENGKLTNGTFSQYAPIVMRDAPAISVTVLSDPSLPMGGVGEPGVAPVLGAVANAIYDAVGARVFQAPFTAERILEALGNA
ncbi:MAG TPA: molybdopterin cofactor-binding domain-containing protein, partial [Thermomicrobiales bacterium]|nr:molybdopterin cofactor-binding domain-containing protein [Thermomicrobiales bacterium]